MKTKLLLLLSFFSLLIVSCERDDDSNDNRTPAFNTPSATEPNSYFPLSVGNQWFYSQTTQSGGDTIPMGQNYMKIKSLSISNDIDNYIFEGSGEYNEMKIWREANNDLYYQYIAATTNIFKPAAIFLKNTPLLNASWENSDGSDSCVVSSLTASFATYTNLLEIKHYNENDVLSSVEYFKKGIGLIGGIEYLATPVTSIISSYQVY